MKSSIAVLFILSLILVIANGQYYRNSESATGRVPFYRKPLDQYQQPSTNYVRSNPQGVQNDYDRERRQDEYKEAVGPVHTFVKTDEHANYKWGVRHYIG